MAASCFFVEVAIFLCFRSEETQCGVQLVDQRRPTGVHLQYEYGDGDGDGARSGLDVIPNNTFRGTVRRGTVTSHTVREELSLLCLTDDLGFCPHWPRRGWIREAGPESNSVRVR